MPRYLPAYKVPGQLAVSWAVRGRGGPDQGCHEGSEMREWPFAKASDLLMVSQTCSCLRRRWSSSAGALWPNGSTGSATLIFGRSKK